MGGSYWINDLVYDVRCRVAPQVCETIMDTELDDTQQPTSTTAETWILVAIAVVLIAPIVCIVAGIVVGG